MPSTAIAITTDHKRVGKACLVLSLVFLLTGGALAGLMRAQLAQPGLDVLDRVRYQQAVTLHATFAVFLFLMPAWAGLGFALVPLQIGARALAFPRLAAFAMWLFAAAAIVVVVAAVRGGTPGRGGWALDPLQFQRGVGGRALDLWLVGLALAGAATVAAAVNLLTTVLKLRAPGLTSPRTPTFTWSITVASAVLLIATPVLLAGLTLMFVGHRYGGRAFDVTADGDPLVWRQLFWFFAHPALWALVLPAFGVVSEIVPVFTGRPLVRYRKVLTALAAAGALSFFGWGIELADDSSVPGVLFAVTALLVLAPLALVVLAWLGTMRKGRRDLRPPMAHALGLVTVVAVGMAATAVMDVARTAKPGVLTYWWVGAWHDLLVGGGALGVVTAACYWAPKLWGRHLSPRLSGLQLLLLVVGAHVSFLAMLGLGLQGMGRHRASYGSGTGWAPANLVSTLGSYLVAAGVLVFLVNVAWSARRGARATADPWGGHTLEWATSSPPPAHNFDTLPAIRSERPLLDGEERETAPRQDVALVGAPS